MANRILKHNASWYKVRAGRWGLSPEVIAASIGGEPDSVQKMLDGVNVISLPFRIFFTLYGGAHRDARNALAQAIKQSAGIDTETMWKPIPGFPRYDASTQGQIRRHKRLDGKPIGTVLNPTKQPSGHLFVSVYDEAGKQKRTGVHRLVALAFHGHPSEGQTLVRHLNGIPDDNRPVNLKWGTSLENAADAKKHSLHKQSVKYSGNMTETELRQLRKTVKTKMKQRLEKLDG